MNPQETSKIMAVLAEEYRRLFVVSEERILLWQKVLSHATYEEAMTVAAAFLSEDIEFPPNCGQFNRRVLALRAKRNREAGTAKILALPNLSEEDRARNKKFLSDLHANLVKKKAMSQ